MSDKREVMVEVVRSYPFRLELGEYEPNWFGGWRQAVYIVKGPTEGPTDDAPIGETK